MTQTSARSFPGADLALAPLQRQDLPSFLVAVPSARVLEATSACAALGLFAGTPAPQMVAAVARELSRQSLVRFGYARLRLPGSFVPRLFRYAPLALPSGAAVLFADPAAFAPGSSSTEPPSAPAIPVALQPLFAQPVRITFETDAEGRIRALSPVFAHALGSRADQFMGATFAVLENEGLLQSSADIADAIAGGSFSDVKAHVPAATPDEAALDLSLGGAPVFDAGRRRQGTRGFGVLSAAAAPPLLAQTRPAPPAPLPPASEPAGFGENVVPLRSGTLSPQERSAFREIARTLAAAIEDWPKPRPDLPRLDPQPNAPLNTLPHADVDVPARSEPPGIGHAPEPDAPPASEHPAAPDDLDLLDHLPLGLLVQQDGAATYANRTLLTLTGWEDLADIAAAGGLDALLVRDGASLHLATAAGTPLPVEVRLVAAPFLGRPALVHVIRPLSEAEGREARAIARRDALDMVPWPLFLLEPDGTIRFANRAAAERLGFSALDLAGEPFIVAVAPQDRAAVVAAMDRVAAGAAREQITLALRDRAGTVSPARAGLTRAGAEDQMLCVVVDPEPPAVPAAASAGTDLLPRFASRLRQALAAPLARLTGMPAPAALSGPERDAFAAVASTLDDLATLAATVEAAAPERCDLAGLVSATVAALTPAARRRGIALRLDAPDAVTVTTLRPQVTRLARLMLEEAVAATPAGASVSISVFDDGTAGACLQVSDGGAALDEVALAAARDPLAPLPTPAADRFAAAGRPLRLARLAREAESLGGTFEVAPEPARGMIARLRLP
ncbi:PAS domain-containing protein [Xanthobacter oligotrophicus]|nr:PAS domain-containing protein [Xanthobacter oligotrophicus]MCG5237541.1 PAS domain-containing protein [Xanthobacter oligotrophicus]